MPRYDTLTYLTGKVLTGSKEEVADHLATYPMPSLARVATDEVARLRSAFPSLTADGRGVDIVAAFGEEIGVDADTLAKFMQKHSVFRNHTYVSDPFVVSDVFNNDRSLNDAGGTMSDMQGPAQTLQFLPATTWSKPGDGVFRFTIMHRYIEPDPADGKSTKRNKQLRVPVIMMDTRKLDTIVAHDGKQGPVLTQLRDLMATACHDYIHSTFLFYLKQNAPGGVQEWDDRLAGGKQIWRESPFTNYNYEVLASIGHRKIMERIYAKHPEVKAGIIARVGEFADAVDWLCHSMKSNGEKAQAVADMERYLMTNYMRFAYHIVKPDEPELGWVKERYGYIEKDLNIHNGKGLVSILHAHDGVPGKDTGDQDISFRDWLNTYVTQHIPVMEEQPHYMTRMERKVVDLNRRNTTGQGGGRGGY